MKIVHERNTVIPLMDSLWDKKLHFKKPIEMNIKNN